MAVQEQTPYIEHIANGVTTSFALGFACKDKDHLIVSLNNDEAPVGIWSLENNAVTFNIPPANGVLVALERNTPFQRVTDYQSYDNSFRPSPVNNDFDLIWWKLQELGHKDQVQWLALIKEITDRINQDNNLKDFIGLQIKGVEADYISRDSNLKNYIDQMIKLVTGDSNFTGVTSDFVIDNDLGLTQEAINKIQNAISNGKRLRHIAGAIRNDGTGWKAIVDAFHGPINFASIEVIDNIYLRIKFAGENSKVIYGSVSCDEAYSRLGLQLGPSVGVSSMDVMGYLPLEFSVTTDGSNPPIVDAIPEIKNRITPSRSGTKIRINHSGSIKDFPMVSAISGSPTAKPIDITPTALNILQETGSSAYFFRVWYEAVAGWKFTTNMAGTTIDTSQFSTNGNIVVNLGTAITGNDYLIQSISDRYKDSIGKIYVSGLSSFTVRFVDPATNSYKTSVAGDGLVDSVFQYGIQKNGVNTATSLPAGTYNVKRGLIPVYWNELTSPTSYGQNGNLWFFAIIEY